MKILYILFITLIAYSKNIQEITLGAPLKDLIPSTTDDYFYFKVVSQLDVHILLKEDNYNLNNPIEYCSIYSYNTPTESTIKKCSFMSLYHYDSTSTAFDCENYYKIHLSTSYNYIIIKYSGGNRYGTIKARAVIPCIDNVYVDTSYQIKLTTHTSDNTYFYTKISYPPSNYIYFNLSDTSNYLDTRIKYCITDDDPYNKFLKAISDCKYFSNLNYYKSRSDKNKNEYYYKIYTYSHSSSYVFVQYKYLSSLFGELYAKSSYHEFDEDNKSSNFFNTLLIVSVSIAGVAFLGIIITIICYCCKKRAVDNNYYVQAPPAVVMTANPTYPLVEQNNGYPPNYN